MSKFKAIEVEYTQNKKRHTAVCANTVKDMSACMDHLKTIADAEPKDLTIRDIHIHVEDYTARYWNQADVEVSKKEALMAVWDTHGTERKTLNNQANDS